ncbi:hypothetical protein RHGRI_013848 [Rhododendron griersonianum]|uniref:Uncharacterized protein n=1 Tax=Rhododendron griersonianum TaxID=479676 RepID=A0AAV6K7E2_9ERIC|nr:hypothetical protein RHGRI_013848 [Rhododendron griersonianum]
MASLHILKCGLSPLSVSKSRRKLCGGKVSNFQNHRSPKILSYRSFRVACKVQEDDNQSKGPAKLTGAELIRPGQIMSRDATSLCIASKSSGNCNWSPIGVSYTNLGDAGRGTIKPRFGS